MHKSVVPVENDHRSTSSAASSLGPEQVLARIVSWLLALCTLAAGGVQLARSVHDGFNIWLKQWLPGSELVWLTFACALLLLLVLIVVRIRLSVSYARSRSHSRARSGKHSALVRTRPRPRSGPVAPGATTVGVVGVAMAALSLLVASLYPVGVMGRPATAAPFGNSEQAQAVIERELAGCKSQWLSLGEADMPGISFGIMCPSQHTMYAEFFHDADQEHFASIVDKAGPALMRNYMSAEKNVAVQHFCSVSGTRWLAITPMHEGENLHHLLGGEIADLGQ
ncbi:hypothetical protein KIMH_02650 [Bombiscardovia apis]|uniref:Uncharacterized protein n=1 Tax=Bombiscardovia apis TaxID=2932182 RepID=A0ABM8BB71_9BIFI|nr:hypothetical protein [Bombiscardovia apis]BDR54154.1 hypothetical protein KIMH_02650 [Bombiscardovia apis]